MTSPHWKKWVSQEYVDAHNPEDRQAEYDKRVLQDTLWDIRMQSDRVNEFLERLESEKRAKQKRMRAIVKAWKREQARRK